MAESKTKITWQTSGSTKFTKFLSGTTISQLKNLSTEERKNILSLNKQPNLPPKNLSKSGVTPTVANHFAKTGQTLNFKTAVEQIKSTFNKTSELFSGQTFNLSGKTKTVRTSIETKPSGTTKGVSSKFKLSASTKYEKSVSGNTKSTKKLSLPPNTSITDFISGTIDSSFPSNGDYGFAGDVYVTLIQPDGKILVGGDFEGYTSPDYPSGYFSPYFIRLNADGTVDDSFVSGYLNGDVLTIALQSDGKILIGGLFNYEDYNATNPGHI